MTDVNPNDERETISDSESRLIEALLVRTCASNSHEDKTRVDRLLSAISQETEALASLSSHQAKDHTRREWPARPFLRRPRWWMLPAVSAALVFLLLAYLPEGTTENQAIAALDESLRADAAMGCRHYLVTMRPKNVSGKTATERQSDLFLNGEDFVIHVHRPRGDQGIWTGRYRGEHWLVPRVGPVMVSADSFLKNRMFHSAVAETPFLSISAVLERTKRHYDLNFKKAVELVTPRGKQRCSLVTGVRKNRGPLSAPQSVKVWADQESGFVIKVELGWGPDDQAAWLSATAEWMDRPDLNDDFFQHQAHHEPERRVIDQESE